MTRTVETWVGNYRAAWESNDPGQIRSLFTDDAVYERVPHDPKAWRGVDAIVAGWLSTKDEPGSTTFEWELLGVAGDRAFVQGASVYSKVTYDNLWVLRLAPDPFHPVSAPALGQGPGERGQDDVQLGLEGKGRVDQDQPRPIERAGDGRSDQ